MTTVWRSGARLWCRMKFTTSLALVVAAAVAVSASTPNYNGTWSRHSATGSHPNGGIGSWPAVTSAFGNMFVTSGWENKTYSYAWTTDAWTFLANNPKGVSYRAADLIYTSGSLLMWGGKSATGYADTLYALSTLYPADGWKDIATVANALNPPGRNRHTLTLMNSVVYLIGGQDDSQFYHGVWGFDVSLLITNDGTTSWTQVISDNQPGGPLFSPRSGHSVATYENRMYLFGGFYMDLSRGRFIPCSVSTAECTWYNDLWQWTPPTKLEATTSTWEQVNVGDVKPPPRHGHVAAFIESNRMMVFGGRGADDTPLNDLWQYDEHTKGWSLIKPLGSTPPALDTPIGAAIGRHFVIYGGGDYVYEYSPYDWVPEIPSGSNGVPTTKVIDDCVKHSDVQGINAGLVIAILIGIAQLVFVVFLWHNAGHPGLCCGNKASASPYAPMSSSSA